MSDANVRVALDKNGEIHSVQISFFVGSIELSKALFKQLRDYCPLDVDDFSFIEHLCRLGFWKVSPMIHELVDEKPSDDLHIGEAYMHGRGVLYDERRAADHFEK